VSCCQVRWLVEEGLGCMLISLFAAIQVVKWVRPLFIFRFTAIPFGIKQEVSHQSNGNK
jgi:hypothetical protein